MLVVPDTVVVRYERRSVAPLTRPAGLWVLSGCVSGVLGGVPTDLVGPPARDLSDRQASTTNPRDNEPGVG